MCPTRSAGLAAGVIEKDFLPPALALGAVLALMLYASLAVAVDVPASKKNTKTIQGPIKITSQHADFDERDKRMLYRGNVLLVSQELELRGERLELRQPGTGLYEAHVTGRPARLNHAGAQGTPPLSARANQIVYNTQASTVALSGGVQLERGTDVLTGENIRYNAVSRRISASGANGGQVKIVIQPPAAPGASAGDKRSFSTTPAGKEKKK